MRKPIIGVMGPGKAEERILNMAYILGKQIAANEWVTLSGGRNVGIMHAVSRGAKDNQGITLGILPGNDYQQVSEYVDIPVITGMGSARNNINVLTADVVVACGIGAGTASEIALAIKSGKPVLLLGLLKEEVKFFKQLGGDLIEEMDQVEKAIIRIKSLLINNERLK